MSSSGEDLPADVVKAASDAIGSLVPQKSRENYALTFAKYEKWCKEKNIKDMTREKVLLAYFSHLSNGRKPSSLWSYYSMLRTDLSIRKNVDIRKYAQLFALLKRKGEGYTPKKSKILSKEQIATFLQTAEDGKYLHLKVLLIFGVAGACRRAELTNMVTQNVVDEGVCFRVQVPYTKTKISREFFITYGGIDNVNMVDIVRKYILLRPSNCPHNRFFLTYRGNRFINIPIGINSIGAVPAKIAEFLKLPNAKQYTGHCFRRSSTSLLANSGADLLAVKRHGGWKSNSVAEGYIDTSEKNKKNTAIKILGEKMEDNSDVYTITDCGSSSTNSTKAGISFFNCTECVVKIYTK